MSAVALKYLRVRPVSAVQLVARKGVNSLLELCMDSGRGLNPHPALVGTQGLQVELGLLCKSPGQLLGNTQLCVQDELINCLVSHGNGLHNSIAQLYDVTLVGRGIIHVR